MPKKFNEDAELCLIYQKKSLVFLPADCDLKRGEIGWVEVAFSMLGPKHVYDLNTVCTCSKQQVLIGGCICGGI